MGVLCENFTMRPVEGCVGAGFDSADMTSPLPPVALASRSPRRRELLASHGLRHTVIESGIDDGELSPGGASPRAWVMGLAYLKAAAGLDAARGSLGPGWVVLGADTVCVDGGRIIGQPADAAEAGAFIRSFRGRTHGVYTGVAVIGCADGARRVVVDEARVSLGWVDDALVDSYVASGLWRGKAGGYNLLERVGAGWPITYSGDPDGIMGLPMGLVKRVLAGFGGLGKTELC